MNDKYYLMKEDSVDYADSSKFQSFSEPRSLYEPLERHEIGAEDQVGG